MEGRISNQELQKVVHSFNRLNSRLTQSLQQNYQSRLNEQQMHIQVLQAQINHHFLYNTLNVIKSLADIHNVPEIKTIAMCMSELLRYNLKKGSHRSFKRGTLTDPALYDHTKYTFSRKIFI